MAEGRRDSSKTRRGEDRGTLIKRNMDLFYELDNFLINLKN